MSLEGVLDRVVYAIQDRIFDRVLSPEVIDIPELVLAVPSLVTRNHIDDQRCNPSSPIGSEPLASRVVLVSLDPLVPGDVPSSGPRS